MSCLPRKCPNEPRRRAAEPANDADLHLIPPRTSAGHSNGQIVQGQAGWMGGRPGRRVLLRHSNELILDDGCPVPLFGF